MSHFSYPQNTSSSFLSSKYQLLKKLKEPSVRSYEDPCPKVGVLVSARIELIFFLVAGRAQFLDSVRE